MRSRAGCSEPFEDGLDQAALEPGTGGAKILSYIVLAEAAAMLLYCGEQARAAVALRLLDEGLKAK